MQQLEDTDEDKLAIPDVVSVFPQEIQMPPLTYGSEYLIGLLHEAGTAMSTGMGLTGLTWGEIESWQKSADLVGITTPRDLRMIHMLSRAYASEAAMATQKGAVAPYSPPLEEEELEQKMEIMGENLDAMMAAMIASQKNK